MKPSEALERGICPYCLGTGEVDNVIYGTITCRLCHGSKKWPPPDDPSWNQPTKASDLQPGERYAGERFGLPDPWED